MGMSITADGGGNDMETLSLSHELLSQLAQLGAFPGSTNLEQFNGDQSTTATVLQAAGIGSSDGAQQARPATSEQPADAADGVDTQEEGSSQKRKSAPLSEEERKKRRKEINRQSARRIRERKNNEMERLRQQVAALQQDQQRLLLYAVQTTHEKDALLQRTLELTERLNAAAAGNPDMQRQPPVLDGGGAFMGATPAADPAGAADLAADAAVVLGQPV